MNPTMAEVLEIPRKRAVNGSGNITQRGNHYQISFYDGAGRRRRESYPTLEKAQKALKTKLVLKETGKLDAVDVRTKVDTLAALYLADRKGTAPKSYDWLKSVWDNHLEPFFGGYLASRITTEKLIEYRNKRLGAEKKPSPTTINKELSTLESMFNYGHDECSPPKVSIVPRFPKDLKEPPPRQGFLTDEQYEALQAKCELPWLRALLAMAYTFGFRRSELVGKVQRNHPGMKVSQINLKDRTIHLWAGTTKNEQGRVIRMTDEVHKLLKPCVEGKQPDDALFTWENGRPVKDFRQTWDALVKAAGVPHLLLHDFRRSAARNMTLAGVQRDLAKKITGHKTDSMFTRYNIVIESDLEVAAAKIAEYKNSRKVVAESESPKSSSASS